MANNIAAIILAAGQSKRMGQPKMLLPWGKTTVLGQVVTTLANADIADIVVVTGGWRESVEAEVERLASYSPVRSIFNARHETEGMLSSVQAGVRVLQTGTQATLIALGDQPQMRQRSVRDVVEAYKKTGSVVVVPSNINRRGHPFLIASELWNNLLAMRSPMTMRDFLVAHTDSILYVEADESILQDLDTPDDYKQAQGLK